MSQSSRKASRWKTFWKMVLALNISHQETKDSSITWNCFIVKSAPTCKWVWFVNLFRLPFPTNHLLNEFAPNQTRYPRTADLALRPRRRMCWKSARKSSQPGQWERRWVCHTHGNQHACVCLEVVTTVECLLWPNQCFSQDVWKRSGLSPRVVECEKLFYQSLRGHRNAFGHRRSFGVWKWLNIQKPFWPKSTWTNDARVSALVAWNWYHRISNSYQRESAVSL